MILNKFTGPWAVFCFWSSYWSKPSTQFPQWLQWDAFGGLAFLHVEQYRILRIKIVSSQPEKWMISLNLIFDLLGIWEDSGESRGRENLLINPGSDFRNLLIKLSLVFLLLFIILLKVVMLINLNNASISSPFCLKSDKNQLNQTEMHQSNSQTQQKLPQKNKRE